MEKQRILLVEDNAQFRENFVRALERALAADPLDVAFVEASSLGRPGDRRGCERCSLKGRLVTGDHRGNKEADRRRTLGGLRRIGPGPCVTFREHILRELG